MNSSFTCPPVFFLTVSKHWQSWMSTRISHASSALSKDRFTILQLSTYLNGLKVSAVAGFVERRTELSSKSLLYYFPVGAPPPDSFGRLHLAKDSFSQETPSCKRDSYSLQENSLSRENSAPQETPPCKRDSSSLQENSLSRENSSSRETPPRKRLTRDSSYPPHERLQDFSLQERETTLRTILGLHKRED